MVDAFVVPVKYKKHWRYTISIGHGAVVANNVYIGIGIEF